MFGSYPYNNPYQNRLAAMEQQNYQSAQFYFKMMPVSNIEEANATPVDTLNGMPSFFYNRATNEIYMKQFNSNSGGAIFQTYKLQAMEAKQPNSYEIELKSINEKIDGLYSLLKSKEEVANE